jgi:acyl CoA:acetate/3-ketoacid CoA transferase beta subunit
LVANYIPGIDVEFQSENGVLGTFLLKEKKMQI